MSGSGIKTVFGGASMGYGAFKTVEECHDVLKVLKANHVENIVCQAEDINTTISAGAFSIMYTKSALV